VRVGAAPDDRAALDINGDDSGAVDADRVGEM
jgi:hypothetical protein